jgi:putative transposase
MESASRRFDDWAHRNGVQLDVIRPGRPVGNAYIGSFNGRLREECLNQNWFLSLAEVQATIEAWRIDYNQRRPHSALGYRTPEAFVTGWHEYRTAKEVVF